MAECTHFIRNQQVHTSKSTSERSTQGLKPNCCTRYHLIFRAHTNFTRKVTKIKDNKRFRKCNNRGRTSKSGQERLDAKLGIRKQVEVGEREGMI